MKILSVKSDGGDFGFLDFEENHRGETVLSIIERIESGEDLNLEDIYTLEVKEFDYIDPLFAEFLKDEIIDYDHLKNDNFLLEGDIV